MGELRFSFTTLDRDEWSSSRPACFIPRERSPGIHWVEGRVGPRPSLNVVEKRKVSHPWQDMNPSCPPIARCYTDWAILAPDRKVGHPKFRVDMVQCLLLMYSQEHKVTRPHADDNTIARMAQWHFSRRIPPAKRTSKPQNIVLYATDMGKDEKQCIEG
jgi:hypothetical protein